MSDPSDPNDPDVPDVPDVDPSDAAADHAVPAQRTTPDRLRGDKAYSSRGTRALLRSRGVVVVIPEPADQAGHRKRRGSRGGRPIGYDRQDYKNRNVVERFFNRMKQWRALASRYDKHALTYRGGVVLAAILDWLK